MLFFHQECSDRYSVFVIPECLAKGMLDFLTLLFNVIIEDHKRQILQVDFQSLLFTLPYAESKVCKPVGLPQKPAFFEPCFWPEKGQKGGM